MTREWAYPPCEKCSTCLENHPGRIHTDCTCGRCTPWGVPMGASKNNMFPHFCGVLEPNELQHVPLHAMEVPA